MFQFISNLLKDIWAQQKGLVILVFLVGIVMYFVPMFEHQANTAQAGLLQAKTEEAQFWKEQTLIERHINDSLVQVILVAGQTSVKELKDKQEKIDALNVKYGDALIKTYKVKHTIEATINKVDNSK